MTLKTPTWVTKMVEFQNTNSAIAVANWFIEQNKTDKTELTQTKLQKLLYYAQGWFLASFDYPLFEDPLEAWKRGPCVESIFRALNGQKNRQVNTFIQGYIIEDGVYKISIPKIHFNSTKEKDFMLSFWEKFSEIDPLIMINSTLNKNTPWHQVYSCLTVGNTTNKIIPLDLLRCYFKNILDSNKN